MPEHNLLPAGATEWDSGRIVLQAPGAYAYMCIIHEVTGMLGKIAVK